MSTAYQTAPYSLQKCVSNFPYPHLLKDFTENGGGNQKQRAQVQNHKKFIRQERKDSLQEIGKTAEQINNLFRNCLENIHQFPQGVHNFCKQGKQAVNQAGENVTDCGKELYQQVLESGAACLRTAA